MDDVRTVLIGGHILVVASVMWSQRTMLEAKTIRINNDRGIVESVEELEIYDEEEPQSKPVETPTTPIAAAPEQPSKEETGESIGDPVDWNQTPETLGDSLNWEDEIELLD